MHGEYGSVYLINIFKLKNLSDERDALPLRFEDTLVSITFRKLAPIVNDCL